MGAERRALSGLPPPPIRAPEDPFNPLRRKDLQDPPLHAEPLALMIHAGGGLARDRG